ncbi:MAG: 8-hydroxy-5-deazaflavin:NADPH oxidoreductase [Mycobacterium sp.]|jgi:predicted dinucleotide-binding enzyme|nr:8-hydroxy-5-deazaflavin:NADPH oxidoreductase [Mycobacterium sp.]
MSSISIIGLGNMARALADRAVAGDDAQAKARVSAFVESLGVRPMDAGRLPMARALENAALLQLGLVAQAHQLRPRRQHSQLNAPSTATPRRTVTCAF